MEQFATMEDVYVGLGDYELVDDGKLDAQLELPESKVTKMKRNLRSPSQRREAYLDLYATGHPCPSWRHITEVLHGVGLRHQADTVESTYVQGRERYIILLLYRGT